MTPREGVGPVPVKCPPLGLIWPLTYRGYNVSARWAPSPQTHVVWLSVHVKSITKTTDGEVALQRRGWSRQAGLALERAA